MTSFIKFWTTLILVMSPLSFPTPSGAYQENPNVNGVIVKGQVTYKGKAPEIQSLQIKRDKAFCGESMSDESLLVFSRNEETKF